MGAYNLSSVDISFALVAPGYSHNVAVDILGRQVLGEQNLGKVDIPVGEDLDKADTLSKVAVGKEELDTAYAVGPVVVAAECFGQECSEEVFDIAD